MKILHTSDWHLGDKLGARGIQRQPHLRKSLEQIAAYLEQHKVDVMLVSGDIFGDRLKPNERLAAIKDIQEVFLPFLQTGGTIIMISGNHDNETLFETERLMFDMVAPAPDGIATSNQPNGRLYLSARPGMLRLADRQHQGEVVQFVLMPYPTPQYYLKPSGIAYTTPAEKHSKMQAEFTRILGVLQKQLEPTQPSVLVSHIFVRGTSLNRAFRLTEAEDVLFERSDIPTHWAYAAYGHIHKPQAIFEGSSHIRYAGSIERMDFDERNDEKSVVYFEVGGQSNQIVDGPHLLPLQTTPFYEVIIKDPKIELPHLQQLYPDSQTALVKYVLHWNPIKHILNDLRREVEQIFPYYYDWSHLKLGTVGNSNNGYVIQERLSVGEIVTDYLKQQLKDDPQQAEILTLANALLAEED